MILTGPKIKQEVANGNIIISPFNEKQLNPNSYDFRIGNKLLVYKNKVLDTRHQNETEEIEIPEEGYVLQPDPVDFCVSTIARLVLQPQGLETIQSIKAALSELFESASTQFLYPTESLHIATSKPNVRFCS